ncbi:MAG: hypothetical protein QGG25_13245 [Phycisphaerae bacterium]|nr:hypothetical protein [Phycisphaerae bacterium]
MWKRKPKKWDGHCFCCSGKFSLTRDRATCPMCRSVYQKHEFYDNMYTEPTLDESRRSWYLAEYANLMKWVAICGDNDGPFIQSSDLVLRVAEHYDQLAGQVTDYVLSLRDDVPFVKSITEIDLDAFFFHDRNHPNQYAGFVSLQFPNDVKEVPEHGCGGNGAWDIALLMRNESIVKLDLSGELLEYIGY